MKMLMIGDEREIEQSLAEKLHSLQAREVLALSSGKDSVQLYIDQDGDVILEDSSKNSVDIIVELKRLGAEYQAQCNDGVIQISKVAGNNLRQAIGEALVM